MKIVGLITEYNPLHNGHLYHIKESIARTGADAAVCVMSGDFVQRGAPAVMPKRLRTMCALQAGIHAVFMLPVRYSTATAALFANAAVRLLDNLGCITDLCFGAETPDLSLLSETASLLADESPFYKNRLQHYLKQGETFASARAGAAVDCTGNDAIKELLFSPNNILAVEYMIALKRQKSTITPVAIRRTHDNYHDSSLAGTIASATAVRQGMKDGNWRPVRQALPKWSADMAQANAGRMLPVFEDDFSSQLFYQIAGLDADRLICFSDVSRELANRIVSNRHLFTTFSSFADLLKTKEMTRTRVSRALSHILLGITARDAGTPVHYARLIGLRSDCSHTLSHICANTCIPVIASARDFSLPDANGKKMLEEDLFAARLYRHVIFTKFNTDIGDDERQPLLKLP